MHVSIRPTFPHFKELEEKYDRYKIFYSTDYYPFIIFQTGEFFLSYAACLSPEIRKPYPKLNVSVEDTNMLAKGEYYDPIHKNYVKKSNLSHKKLQVLVIDHSYRMLVSAHRYSDTSFFRVPQHLKYEATVYWDSIESYPNAVSLINYYLPLKLTLEQKRWAREVKKSAKLYAALKYPNSSPPANFGVVIPDVLSDPKQYIQSLSEAQLLSIAFYGFYTSHRHFSTPCLFY